MGGAADTLHFKIMTEPFMEHPTGDFDNAIEAMADAVTRLRALPRCDEWITFTAQGIGSRPDSFVFSEVRILGTALDLGDIPLDIATACKVAALPESCISFTGSHYVVSELTPLQTAQLIDAIFRTHGHIQPFPDEDDDYAVGAEW